MLSSMNFMNSHVVMAHRLLTDGEPFKVIRVKVFKTRRQTSCKRGIGAGWDIAFPLTRSSPRTRKDKQSCALAKNPKQKRTPPRRSPISVTALTYQRLNTALNGRRYNHRHRHRHLRRRDVLHEDELR